VDERVGVDDPPRKTKNQPCVALRKLLSLHRPRLKGLESLTCDKKGLIIIA